MRDEAIRRFHHARALRNRGQQRRALRILADAESLAGEDLDLLVPLRNERGLVEKDLGDFASARRTYAALLQLVTERSDDVLIHASVLENSGFVERESGDLVAARAFDREAMGILRNAGEPADLAHALTSLAIDEKDLGNLHDAHEAATEAFALAPRDSAQLLAYIRTVLGLIFQLLREWDSARREFVAAVAGYRTAGDRENTAVALHNLATVNFERGRTDTAMRLLRRSLAINRALRFGRGVALDLRRIALYGADAGAFTEARTLLLKARQTAHKTGDVVFEAWCNLDLGRLAGLQGNMREVIRRCTAALTLAEKTAEPFLVHEILLTRGTAWRRLGNTRNASADFETGVEALERIREGILTEDLSLRFFSEDPDAYRHLVELAIEEGDAVGAWQWAERSHGRELERRMRQHIVRLDPASAAMPPISFAQIRSDLGTWSREAARWSRESRGAADRTLPA